MVDASVTFKLPLLLSTIFSIKVVIGVITVDPASAVITTWDLRPVVTSVPPIMTKLPLPPVKVNPPVASVMVEDSPESRVILLLASANTVAPEIYPSIDLP